MSGSIAIIVAAAADTFCAFPTRLGRNVWASAYRVPMLDAAAQPSFDDLGTALSQVTFCVVDLETTGTGAGSEITEIGAVKVRGGEVLGEFQTLIRPTTPIVAAVQALTGISNEMVATAPPASAVLPSFDQFSDGCVWVAHNASFDVGMLRRAYQHLGLAWPKPQVVDTLALARRTLSRHDIRNHKLGSLAAFFGATTTPNHRALADAQATVDVLHGLLERVAGLGITTLEELLVDAGAPSAARRAKRHLAAAVPTSAGVYWFYRDDHDRDGLPRREVLYVGKSNSLRRRVANYFSSSETRPRIEQMVEIATGVSFVECATELEAQVRELRLIDQHRPTYNRRSVRQHQICWLKLTKEPFPRLAVTRQPPTADISCWGPFTSAATARDVAEALTSGFQLRSCTDRLPRTMVRPQCAFGQLGQCLSPCQLGDAAVAYLDQVAQLEQAWQGDLQPMLAPVAARIAHLAARERFEEAAALTATAQQLIRAARRFHRLRSLASCPELVAAAPRPGGWDIHVIRYGRLAGAATTVTAEVRSTAAVLPASAATVLPGQAGLPAATIEEAEQVAAWLEGPGVRLLSVVGEWAWPVAACRLSADLAGLVAAALPPEQQ